jgi:hypothetical protein
MPVGDLPLVLLRRNNAKDHVSMKCRRIALYHALSKPTRRFEVALAESLVRLLQQIRGLGGESGSDQDEEKSTHHLTVTWIS